MTSAPPNPPTQGALEKCAWFLRHLITGIVAITQGNRIHHSEANRVMNPLTAFWQRIGRLTARLAAGTYKPRPKTGPRKNPIAREPPSQEQPRQPIGERKKRNWLGALLVQEQGHRGSLDRLLREPEVVALIEAAPGEMVRPLRSLCFMLGLPAPPILARPKKPPVAEDGPKPPPEAPPPKAPPPPKPPLARVRFPKPRGSLSNRLYRNHRPPGPEGAKNSA